MRWFPHIALVLAAGSACRTLAGFEDFEGGGGAATAGRASSSEAGDGGMAGSRGGRGPALPAGAGGSGGSVPGGGGAPSRGGASSSGQAGEGGADVMQKAGSGGTVATSGGAAGGSLGGGAGSPAGGASDAGGQDGAGGEDVGGCGQQLLRDGAFDTQNGAWEVDPFVSLPVIVPASQSELVEAGVTPHSGDHLAWLGGVPDTEASHYVTVDQWVTIPQETIRLVLSGQLWIRTAELPGTVFDSFYIQLMDERERPLWLPKTWSNVDATTGWTAFEFDETELDAIRGRAVLFRVESRTDTHTVTDFWVDSLRLEADCGR